MITRVNKANADKYSFLYSQASEALRTHRTNGEKVPYNHPEAVLKFTPVVLNAEKYIKGRFFTEDEEKGYVRCLDSEFSPLKRYYQSDDISSLDEYFSYIVELNTINKIDSQEPPYDNCNGCLFSMLPLDEDVFEIDANSRTIKVPENFKKNGISVQGDEVAEIVYFKINRFFDSTDLATKEVFIQWRSSAKDEAGNFIEGVSRPWGFNTEVEPGYIVFGWPLSSKITSTAGDVEFAVRFYEFKDIPNDDGTFLKKLVYSLSTLVQKATIKPSLNFDLKNILLDKLKVDDMTDLIDGRFENTKLNNGAVQALLPTILMNLPTLKDLDLDPETGFKEKNIELSVQAMAEDAGQLSYNWKKYSIDDDTRLQINSKTEYIPTKDLKREVGKLYFHIVEGSDLEGHPTYHLYGGDVFDAEADGYPVGGIFERVSTGVIDGIGKYYVTITNRIVNSTANIDTAILLVKRPVTPVIAKNLANADILDKAKDYKLTLKTTSTITDAGTLTYQWYKKDPGTEEFKEILGATKDSYDIVGGAEEDPNTGATGDGYYKVVITNHLNKEIVGKNPKDGQPIYKGCTDTIESVICRVTHTAAQPDVQVISEHGYLIEDILKDKQFEVKGTIPAASGENCQRTPEDKITYQWYRYNKGLNSNYVADKNAAAKGMYIIEDDILIEGATLPTFKPTPELIEKYHLVEWPLFCHITNTYNGTATSRNSSFLDLSGKLPDKKASKK